MCYKDTFTLVWANERARETRRRVSRLLVTDRRQVLEVVNAALEKASREEEARIASLV